MVWVHSSNFFHRLDTVKSPFIKTVVHHHATRSSSPAEFHGTIPRSCFDDIESLSTKATHESLTKTVIIVRNQNKRCEVRHIVSKRDHDVVRNRHSNPHYWPKANLRRPFRRYYYISSCDV